MSVEWKKKIEREGNGDIARNIREKSKICLDKNPLYCTAVALPRRFMVLLLVREVSDRVFSLILFPLEVSLSLFFSLPVSHSPSCFLS